MGFKITCYGKTSSYNDSDRQEMLEHYADGYLNTEGNEQRRYLNILYGLLIKQDDIKDYDGDLTKEASENELKVSTYAEKIYFKSHLMEYCDYKVYIYNRITENYPNLSSEIKNELMEEIADKAIEISDKAIKDELMPGGLCKVVERNFDDTPEQLFVEASFLDELITGKDYFKDYLHYDYSIKDRIEEFEKESEFEKEDILEDRA